MAISLIRANFGLIFHFPSTNYALGVNGGIFHYHVLLLKRQKTGITVKLFEVSCKNMQNFHRTLILVRQNDSCLRKCLPKVQNTNQFEVHSK